MFLLVHPSQRLPRVKAVWEREKSARTPEELDEWYDVLEGHFYKMESDASQFITSKGRAKKMGETQDEGSDWVSLGGPAWLKLLLFA